MRRALLAALVAAAFAVPGVAIAEDEDYAAYPPGNEEHCQELGDDAAGENDNTGLAVADEATGEVIETLQGDDDCDNSGGNRP